MCLVAGAFLMGLNRRYLREFLGGGIKIKAALEKLILNAANLIKVKTLITLMVLGALTAAFLRGIVPVELYASIATAIITYYFTRADNKKEEN